MTDDPADAARAYLRDEFRSRGVQMKAASLALRHSHSYFYEYFTKGKPRWIPETDRAALMKMLPSLDASRLMPPEKEPLLAPIGDDSRKTKIDAKPDSELDDDADTVEMRARWERLNPDDRRTVLRIIRAIGGSDAQGKG